VNESNISKSSEFRRAHEGGELLILTNAWDGASAKLIEALGAKAIATTSAGVAWSHGFPDGEILPIHLLVATVADITRCVRLPVTVDVEGGYSPDPIAVGEAVAGVIEAGAVGINLEDGTASPEVLCAKIERVKQVSIRLGVDLFINVRTDVYLRSLTPPEKAIEETLARARLYRQAGGDGLFVPGLRESAAIKRVAEACGLPLNVMALPGLPVAAELQALGVRRLSAGSALAQAAWKRVQAVGAAFLRTGDSTSLFEAAVTYPEMNALFPST
jgi:2-methylisocitrate lyase-like PEP mutase family enzyme